MITVHKSKYRGNQCETLKRIRSGSLNELETAILRTIDKYKLDTGIKFPSVLECYYIIQDMDEVLPQNDSDKLRLIDQHSASIDALMETLDREVE